MSVASHVGTKKRKKSDSKPYSQINKCLNEKRRREQENIHIEELAELVSASPSDMSSLSCKPDKCAILKETVNQIRSQKELGDTELCDDLQQSEVSSSKPNIINNQVFGAILLEAIDGFIFVVNSDGKLEFVSENISSFLNFSAEEVNEKIVYDYIHPDDRARFHSNLLLMMPLGNGRDWSSENFISNKPTKHFTCRFLVKQDEDTDLKMENKSPPSSQYENLNITANFIPLEDGNSEPRNGLTCIARRVPFEEKRIGMNSVEQFTTRNDREGKVIDIDTSNLTQSSSQFLRKELKTLSMLDLCHPSDIATFKQHLKETFENGQATSAPFKFRIEQDRYARIQSKSKVFSVDDYAVTTHSIIRESESSNQHDGLRSISSPSTASTSSGPECISDSSTSVNGSVVLSPMGISNYSNPLSASNNNTEYGLSDLVLDIFPSSNWTLDPGSAQSKESDCTSVASYAASPQAAPLSNRSEVNAVASPTSSAFASGITSSRGGSSVSSPAMQSRAPTPYGGSCYSPSTSQSTTNGRSPPPRALSAKSDSLNLNSVEPSLNNLGQSFRQDKQQQLSNQKLRNLLTQNTDDSALRHNLRAVTQEEVVALLGSRVLESNSRMNFNQNIIPPSDNVILRDLLSQDDDNGDDVPIEPIKKTMESSVPNPMLNVGACKAAEKSAQQRQLGNNMLRKLLNNDDSDKGYRKTDIIQQLLVSHPSSSVSLHNEKLKSDSIQIARSVENSVPKQLTSESNRGTPEITFLTETAVKRKSSDRNSPNTSNKKPNTTGTHLAGQNPMLASMLAQTPRTPPSVPTSVVNSIMTQLPQERLPKNLEKKLVHTPVTTSNSSTPTSSLSYTSVTMTSPSSVQRDVVTSGGHVLQQPTQFAIQSGLRQATYLQLQQLQQQQQQQQQHQGILDKILSSGTNGDSIMIPRSLAVSLSNMSNPIQQSSTSFTSPTVSETIASSTFAEILNEANLVDIGTVGTDGVQSNQISDPGFDALLDQIYSLREEHNLEIPRGSDDPQAILKLLGDTLDISQANSITPMSTVPSAQEIDEKIAISAIQKELEGTAAAIANKANQNAAVISTYSQAGRSLTQVSGTHVVQAQITPEQLILLQQQQQQQQQQQNLLVNNSLPPNYNLVTNRVRLPTTTVQTNVVTQNVLAQAQRRANIPVTRNINLANADVTLLRLHKTAKQRALLQQHQKRLLEQQKQQLAVQTQQSLDTVNSPGSSFTTENINDLLNNTVAPNVTLLRSSGIPDVPGSARFNLISANSLPSPTNQTSPTPAQLSPGQRVNQPSPFSLSQQPFPSQTPPHSAYQSTSHPPPPSYHQGVTSHSPSPISSTASSLMVLSPQATGAGTSQWNQRTTSPLQNLQLQNPMLNAQLSQQASIGAKLTAQQKQIIRTLQASTNNQNARNIVLTQQQADVNYNPVSPVMVLQSQASQQQRVQRGRIPSGTQNQTNFSANDSVLSPQSLPSPSYNQAANAAITSAFVSLSSPGVTYSLAPGGQQFTFERQSIQVFTTSPNDNLRSSAVEQNTSDNLQTQLRIISTSQNQLSSNLNQQLLQSLTSNNSLSGTRVVNVNSLSREALEELGLSVELLPAETQPSPQLAFQALLNDASSLETASQPISPRVQVEEPKPDQKKSLLQQLLSEPT